ncbi:FAD-dependent oxidoreductase [Gammaproteobacteria bacterium]|jgi:glycine cleavage system aminomethyltransferase T/glycine/D-amino acid oxidase-like deaminating enzyme|nr:FAD-dependent oxidoreductase [Gammaproteobacteria bacterium]MDA8916967.1 FAD-dependent oxidoreductase [Gammaproteobacteria bacterium]MDA9570507.1 FAD-dependent oxidoreductase [Gammaproteobacteria bacterium]MDA9920821.1 FAD-dependent oxidoreductase [Gammaproteobacteria bacterium]MDB2447772.1 FAD-dependent oxidoreductase [Gammaproteobacteria bacterium]
MTENTNSKFPKEADVVIVGVGGIVGSMLAYWLADLGQKNIVGLEKSSVIPSDIASTAHASDFVYNTTHDKLGCWTTEFSRKFYEDNGFFLKKGGLEICRTDDDARWEELKRKVSSGKAFGTNVRLISAAEAKEKFPLLEEDSIRGAMWDPDAGLVTPRSQDVVSFAVETAKDKGALKTFTDTPAIDFEIENGRVVGVKTDKGTIKTEKVVIASGIWGPLMGKKAGVPVPLMPLEHPLLFFGPLPEAQDAKDFLVYPLLRDQGNSAYVRDTGRLHGGMLEWGFYEDKNPRLVDPEDIGNPEKTMGSDSMRYLDLEEVAEPLEKAFETTPILNELGWDEKSSFNGLLSVTPDAGSLIGESPEVRGFWLCEAVWVKDGPGCARLCAEAMVNGKTQVDMHSFDISRFYPEQKEREFVKSRAYENSQTIYTPAVHPREPYISQREKFVSPFYEREKELGGHFDNEVACWERAFAYESNREKLGEYLKDIPVRENEWDRRHVPYELANAEHLAMSDSVGMINLSHFPIMDIEGPDAEKMLEYLSVAKVGGNTPIGKVIYTNFLDEDGGVHADLTISRLAENKYRIVTGGADGNRDWVVLRNYRDDMGLDADINIRTHDIATLGLWGPDAEAALGNFVDPGEINLANFPFVTAKNLTLNLSGGKKVDVWAARISYVGESGWEIYLNNNSEEGLALYDSLLEVGVIPVGIETYANSRRLEKSFRLQGADLETEYNACEAAIQRPLVKEADFHGKAAHLTQREEEPCSILCTMTADDLNVSGETRYPVGISPIIDPDTGEVPVDNKGRRSYTTGMSYCPSIKEFVVMGYLPKDIAKEGKKLSIEYFNEDGDGLYPMTVKIVGKGSLYDPKNEKVRT